MTRGETFRRRPRHPVQLYESAGLLVIAIVAGRVLRTVNAGTAASSRR